MWVTGSEKRLTWNRGYQDERNSPTPDSASLFLRVASFFFSGLERESSSARARGAIRTRCEIRELLEAPFDLSHPPFRAALRNTWWRIGISRYGSAIRRT